MSAQLEQAQASCMNSTLRYAASLRERTAPASVAGEASAKYA